MRIPDPNLNSPTPWMVRPLYKYTIKPTQFITCTNIGRYLSTQNKSLVSVTKTCLLIIMIPCNITEQFDSFVLLYQIISDNWYWCISSSLGHPPYWLTVTKISGSIGDIYLMLLKPLWVKYNQCRYFFSGVFECGIPEARQFYRVINV